MATPPLNGRYKRYKQLNQDFESWLLKEARKRKQCCDDVLHIPDKLNTTQFLDFTKYVCSAGAPSLVTPDIVEMVAEVVHLRRQAIECYAAVRWKEPELTDDKTLLSNQTHRHFFQVLQQVLSMLRSAVSSTDRPKCKANNKSRASSTPKTSNFFAQLPLEEPAACPMGQQPTSRNEGLNPAKEAADVDEDNEEAEKEFAIICFFQDARDLRRHLLGVWKRFYQGDISFAVATEITEIAFNMLYDLDEALWSHHEDLRIIDQIYKSLGINKDYVTNDDDRVISKILHDFSKVPHDNETADLYCTAGWLTAYKFEDLCYARRSGKIKRPEESSSHGHPFTQELLRLQPDIQKLVNIAGSAQWDNIAGLELDCFTHQLLGACKDSDVPAAFVVQCQVMLDIYDTLGGNCAFAYDALRCVARKTIESFDNLSGGLFSQNGGSKGGHEEPLGSLYDRLELILKDKYSAPSKRGHKQKPSTMLKALPLLSGRNLNFCNENRYESSLWACNGCNTMLSAAYLYKAVKMASSKDISWPGMDFVIEKQSKRSAYVRDANNIKSFFRLFDIALGHSAVNFARRTRKERENQAISENILKNARRLETTPRGIIATEKVKDMTRSNTNGTTEYYTELYFIVHDPEKSKQPQKDHEPVSLLTDLEKVFSSDEAELTFDYLAVAAQSKYLLQSVAQVFDSKVKGLDLPSIPEYEMVRILFWLAATTKPRVLYQIGLIFNDVLDKCPTKISVASTLEKPCERWKWRAKETVSSPAGCQSQVENGLRLRHLDLTESWVARHILLRPDAGESVTICND